MAQRRVNPAMTSPGAGPVDAYLADLAERLLGPRRLRRRILAELCDGLDHAVEGNRAAGMADVRAQTEAVAGFGSPQAVADAFSGELATAYARRTVALYILTGPLVGLWWLLLLRPDPWRAGLSALLAAIPVIPVIAVAVAAAGTTVATTGRLMRWLPETGPRRALSATLAIAGLCLLGDITMIGLYAGSAAGPLAVLAVAASGIRSGCGVAVLRRSARLRRRLRQGG